jgi:hypothetical protein
MSLNCPINKKRQLSLAIFTEISIHANLQGEARFLVQGIIYIIMQRTYGELSIPHNVSAVDQHMEIIKLHYKHLLFSESFQMEDNNSIRDTSDDTVF